MGGSPWNSELSKTIKMHVKFKNNFFAKKCFFPKINVQGIFHFYGKKSSLTLFRLQLYHLEYVDSDVAQEDGVQWSRRKFLMARLERGLLHSHPADQSTTTWLHLTTNLGNAE
jgi:hypothetical protein